MKVLIEFVILGGFSLVAVAYGNHVAKMVKQRGYLARFVGGPLDGQEKRLRVLPEEYTELSPRDYRGNRIRSVYRIDEMKLGVYTFVRDEVL